MLTLLGMRKHGSEFTADHDRSLRNSCCWNHIRSGMMVYCFEQNSRYNKPRKSFYKIATDLYSLRCFYGVSVSDPNRHLSNIVNYLQRPIIKIAIFFRLQNKTLGHRRHFAGPSAVKRSTIACFVNSLNINAGEDLVFAWLAPRIMGTQL